MKQLGPEEALQRYRTLLERYHTTLDLLSDRGLEDLDRLIGEAEVYADVIARVAPSGGAVLDLGSGAGLPGVVVAIRLPDRQVILSERRKKRASFLTLVAGQLGLDNVRVAQGDVRQLSGVEVDVVMAQAVAGLATVVALTKHVASPNAVVVSRKGPSWQRELVGVRAEGFADVTVVAEEPLGHRGTLVALRLAGG